MCLGKVSTVCRCFLREIAFVVFMFPLFNLASEGLGLARSCGHLIVVKDGLRKSSSGNEQGISNENHDPMHDYRKQI